MRSSISRRQLLQGLGFGALAAACSHDSFATPLARTPQLDDGDGDHGPLPAAPPEVCSATADNIEGPFYRAGAPSRATFVRDRDPGERLVLAGTVRSTACRPLAGAVLDIWHADAAGDYDNDGYTFRGTLVTDARGRWQLRTIVPGRYLNGKRYRPAHIHVKVRARGHAELTTQLYFAGDPYLEGDPFVVDSLIMAHERARDGRTARFDFTV